MNHILAGKNGLIFGALDEKSIAWQVALQSYAEGAHIVLSNAPVALRLGTVHKLAEQCNAPLIAADATSTEDLRNLYVKTLEHFGGKIDFILHAIGMSPNIRKGKSYTSLDYSYYQQTIDISAMSLHKILQTASSEDALNEYASIVALSYIAAQKTFPNYGDMADAKAMLESIARNFGYYLGKEKKIRINTVSQSPTKTTAGTGIKGFDNFYDYADTMSPLGNASAEDCAKFCVALFSDYSRMVTMQNLYHDGGFSTTGM
jgi:enoyl-[acyl-carrier protein] reductase I